MGESCGLSLAMEVITDTVTRAPLEVAVVVRFDVRVNGSSNTLAVDSVSPADSFQRLIRPTQDQGRGRRG